MRIAAIALGVLVAGCSASVRHPAYAPQPGSALMEVTAPPPPARVEMVPARPTADAVWVDGEWTWRRGRWAWTLGRWVIAPSGGAFSPWVFERGPDGRLWYAPGVWRDGKGAPLDPPVALASATAEASAVVNAEGTVEITGPIRRPNTHRRTTVP
jgi:hypothetical protein